MTHSTENIRAEKERIAEITKAQKAIERENKIAAKKATKLLKKSDLSSVSNNRLEEMVNSPCNPNTQDKKGNTLLIEATQRNNAVLVEKLLEKGANPKQKYIYKVDTGRVRYRTIYIPNLYFFLNIAEWLIVKPIELIVCSALAASIPALMSGAVGLLAIMFSAAISGNPISLFTKIATGLTYAITTTSMIKEGVLSDIFKFPNVLANPLRDKFYEFDFKTREIKKREMIPYDIAIENENHKIIDLFRKHEAKRKTFSEKVLEKCQKSIRKKLAKELAKFDFEKGTEEDFNNLIENGADINKLDKKTQNKLIETANEKNPVLAAKLKEAQNEAMNSWDKTWGTVNWKASHDEVTGKINQLIADGANVNLQNDFGATPLICVANIRNTEAATALINAGANVNMQIKTGQTALMAAVLTNNAKLVETLLEAGADKTIKARTSKTALDMAFEKKNQAIIDLLQQSDKKVVAKKGNKVQYIMQNDNALVRC